MAPDLSSSVDKRHKLLDVDRLYWTCRRHRYDFAYGGEQRGEIPWRQRRRGRQNHAAACLGFRQVEKTKIGHCTFTYYLSKEMKTAIPGPKSSLTRNILWRCSSRQTGGKKMRTRFSIGLRAAAAM